MFTLLVVLNFSLYVLANTEIVNFHLSKAYDNNESPFASNWTRLNYTYSEQKWAVIPAPFGTPLQEVCPQQLHSNAEHPCPHELWLVLDLTHEWSAYSSFTLRLSWPASYPADFDLQIFDTESLSAHFGASPESSSYTTPSTPSTRSKYARIRLVDTGILTPSLTPHATSTKLAPSPVPFILTLEPLYFGVLPHSVVPVLVYIVLVCAAAWMVVPVILDHFVAIAAEARKELSVNIKQE